MNNRNPWAWVPTLYFAEGVPYVAVMTISVIIYKRLGLSNADITLYTSWLYLPWVIKPLWSPFVDMLRTKRWWILVMQILIAAALAGVAFTIPGPWWLQGSLAFFWLLAFSSATHDIAADGLAGALQVLTRNIRYSWSLVFYLMAGLFIALWLYHSWALPRPSEDNHRMQKSAKDIMNEFWNTLVTFFKKPQVWIGICFMLFYRMPEGLLAKVSALFLVDKMSNGGLGLSDVEFGMVQGTVGVIGLTLGGILGGIAASKDGLKRWLWPMVMAITIPDLVYVYLSYALPSSLLIINICIFLEQFGYGFGFSAYMLYLIYYSQGEHKTAHYALCTAFMALSMMIPGLFAGALQEAVGYQGFFLIVVVCCAMTYIVSALLKIDPEFGKKKAEN